MTHAGSAEHHHRGFTLVETVVVLVISVGLVAVMTLLYRSVGHATFALAGNDAEWNLQNLIRDQLRHGFRLPEQAALEGEPHRLVFLTWKSRLSGFDGKPVVVQYAYEPATRILSYREKALPAWWADSGNTLPGALRRDLAAGEGFPLMKAVDGLEFRFIPAGEFDDSLPRQLRRWDQGLLPRLVIVDFSRGQRKHTLWLETRSLEPQ